MNLLNIMPHAVKLVKKYCIISYIYKVQTAVYIQYIMYSTKTTVVVDRGILSPGQGSHWGRDCKEQWGRWSVCLLSLLSLTSGSNYMWIGLIEMSFSFSTLDTCVYYFQTKNKTNKYSTQVFQRDVLLVHNL